MNPHKYSDNLVIAKNQNGALVFYNPTCNMFYGGFWRWQLQQGYTPNMKRKITRKGMGND